MHHAVFDSSKNIQDPAADFLIVFSGYKFQMPEISQPRHIDKQGAKVLFLHTVLTITDRLGR